MGTFSDIMSNYNWVGPGMQPVYNPNPTDSDRQEYNRVQRRRAYFDGIKGMAAGTRADWEKRYLKEITGKSPAQRDEFYRNTVFRELFKDSEDPEKQKIWSNRYNMSFRQRDIYVAREIADDYTKKGGPGRGQPDIVLNRQAMNLLSYESERQADKYKEYLHSLDGNDRQNMLNELDEISSAVSPYYKKYYGTNKLNLNDEDKINLAAKFQAWKDIGGNSFAQKALGEYYQNIVANNQSLWEKTVNSGAQFIDSAAGMLIRAAGMLGALTTIGKEEGEGYWENVIDNAVTRYGDRVATTNSYDPEEQKKLEELGLSDNPILNTVAQQESLLSLNTPFELLGQYGFTTASTILSFGSSAAVNALTKGAAWATKVATGAKGLNTTARGIKFLRGLSRAKDIGNFSVVGGIASVEGGMNAAQTKHDVLDKLNADIDNRYRQKAQEDIAGQVRKDPQGAARLLRAKGYDIPERITTTIEGKPKNPYNEQEVNQMIELLQNNEDVISAALQKYSKSMSDDRVAAEETANTAMYTDFIGNSVINGFIHSTLQSTLNAPSVQNTLRKYNLGKSPLDRAGIDVTNQGGRWVANARRYGRLNAFGDRLKESAGEALEEYKQDLSSAYAQGYAEDKYRQYLNNRYAGGSMEDALDNDIASSMAAGFKAVGETALSTEAIKDGLYGGLSTFMGGLNVNSHILNGAGVGNRKEGESFLSYMGRKSPIGWRSGLGPLISSSEADAVNARREEIAKNVNDFFSRPENQEAFFNVNGTSEWMRQLETAAGNKDQMEVRNAKLGVLFSNIVTLNSLRGTGYYDAAIASLQSRANLNEGNLQDENSEEAKLVAMYKQDALNRGQDITDEEALQSIKSSASKMLDTIDKVNKETKEVEKLYGDELDNDVKAGLVFQRLSIEDAKNRMNQLNEELNSVSSALAEESDYDTEQKSQALNRPARTLMARFGSLDRATTRLKELEEDRQKLKENLKSIKSDQKSAITTEEKRKLALLREMSENALKGIKREHRELKSLIDNYTSWTSTEADSYGNLSSANQHIISASDIMRLDAQSRATMLDPSNRENYSQEQQAEIDKVNRVGVQTYQNFASKIQDSSRLAFSYEASMQRQLDMMQNPQLFTREASRIKSEAQERFLKKKYNYLLDLEEQGDYTTFARELDKINDSDDRVAANAAMSLLRDSNSGFLKRYDDERGRLSNLYEVLGKGQVEAYNSLDDNQKSVFADTLRYLSNKGIDINDSDAAVTALAEQDEGGNSLLEHYINDVNSGAPDDVKSVFTSTGEAIQAYKGVMGEYNKSLQEKANNAKDTPVTPTTSEQSAPPKTPAAQGPSLMEMGTSTAEESAKRSQEAEKEGIVEDPVTEAYKENSGQEIASLSKLAANSISNASSTTSNQESKNLALDEVRRLSDVKFDNADNYTDALLQSANKLDSQSEGDGDNEGRAASLLRAAATRVRAKADKTKSEKENTQNTSQNQEANLAQRKAGSQNSIRIVINLDAALMDTIPIAWIRQNYPNSPLVKYYDNHRIEEFLETDFMSNKPTVMFISDPQLAESVKADMESKNLEYTEDNIPLIAVVEVPTGGITIKVDGKDKHFQPIGIMPKTGNEQANGSNRLGAIRNLIDRQDPGQLIKDTDGNIVTTTIGGNVIAEAPKQLPATEPNRSAISLQINDLNEKEKKELQALSKPGRRKNPIYWRIKQAFLKKLAIATPEGKGKYLYYALPNLKGQVIDVRVFTTPVNLTRDRNSNRLISELFNSNEVSAALNSNSRISRAAKELRKFFEKSFDTSEMYFEEDDASNIVPTKSTVKKLNALSEQLTKTIGNFLSLPTRDGWRYVISPTSEIIGDGRRMFTLSLTNNEGSQIELGKVTNGQMQENTQFNILKNLIMDGSSVRMVNNRESFVKWNVPYSDVQNMNSNKAAGDNISDIYDDGILEFSKDSLRYHVKGLSINSPFTMQGEANYTKQDEVSSPTNAQPTTPLNQPVVAANDQVTTSKGTIIDSESGAVLGGESASPTQSSTNVKPIVDSIVANSKIIQLSEDGKYYINTRTGKKYARVTSIIQADEHSDGRFDPNSPWITPSTNIGTGMDELVRDFFAGKLDNDIQAIEVQREMDEIKQKAIADGTFMKAPNGKKSNLTERQWLLVRTKAFKDWFGDWEKAANANRVSLGKEIPNTDKYSKYGQKGETDIEIREVLNEKGNIIGNVRMEFSGKNRKGVVTLHPNLTVTGKGYGTALYQHIADKYNINVEESFGEIGKSEAAKRMWDRIYNAVSKDPDASLRQLTPSNSSKVVDENGEPLIVYHGGAKGITKFKPSTEKESNTGYGYYTNLNTGEKIPLDSNRTMFFSSNPHVGRSYADLYAINILKRARIKINDILLHTPENSEAVKLTTKHFPSIQDVYDLFETLAEFNPRFTNLLNYVKKLQAKGQEISGPRNINEIRKMLINVRKQVEAASDNWLMVGSQRENSLARGNKIINTYNTSEGRKALKNGEIPESIKREWDIYEKIKKNRASQGLEKIGNYDNIYVYLNDGNYILIYDGKSLKFREGLNTKDVKDVKDMTDKEIKNFFDKAKAALHRDYKAIRQEANRKRLIDMSGFYSVFLNIKNPLIHDYEGTHQGQGYKESPKYQFGYVAARQVNKAVKEGNDGVVYQNLYDPYLADNYGVFNPNQIKSATDNVGTNTLESKYPNATRESLEKFIQQLTGLKNSLDAQGLTVVPRDVVATGSIEVTDSEGKKHTIDVAGTLDLLAYNGKGNFYIFDMKTHRSANVGGKIDKWRRQLTLYKTFLESQYGIKVKSLNIIPIKVEYPTPKGVGNSTNEFTIKEGNQLLLNGKEFTGANPNLGMTIALNPIELNVLFDSLTEEEKSQIRESEASQSEVGTVEKVDAKEEGDGSFVEPTTGLRKAKSKDLRRKKKGRGGAVKKPVERLTPVPAKYQWGKFEGATTSDGDTIDAKLATSNLEKAGYTEESWNQLSDEEMQHELDCKGV